jgi:DNA-binding transcriptional LysR family regulator
MLLADVKVFVAIADAGSFTAAAQALHAPKSSVARQLQRLEDELGRTLIARTTRTLRLTDNGKAFLPHARRLIDDEIEARSVLQAGAEGASGLLTVSAPATFGRIFLAPKLPEFLRRHPKVRVYLRLTAAKVQIGVGHTDLAFRLGPLVEPGLASRSLGSIAIALVAAPGYLSARPAIHEPLDLASADFIELRPPASNHRLALFRAGVEQSLRYVPRLEMDDPDAVKSTVLAGAGVAALPRFLVEDELRRGELAQVLPEWAPAPAALHLVYASNSALPLRVRAFLDFFAGTGYRLT